MRGPCPQEWRASGSRSRRSRQQRTREPSRGSAAAPAPRSEERSGRSQLADLDLLHLLEALHHDFHVRLDNRIAQLAELLHVLLVHHFAELLLRNAELLEQRADREECAEERVALHAQLQIAAICRLAGNCETRAA